jgi:hypothetical protein
MKHEASIKLDSQMIAPKPGQIKGAFYRYCDTSQDEWQDITENMSDLFFLQSGQTLSVEAGKSYVVKTRENSWLVAVFQQNGQMTGPLICAETKAETPTETFRKSPDVTQAGVMSLTVMATAIIIGAIASMFLFCPEFVSKTELIGQIVAGSIEAVLVYMFCSAFVWALPFVRLKIFSRDDDHLALRLLHEASSAEPKSIPLSSVHRRFLNQNISIK